MQYDTNRRRGTCFYLWIAGTALISGCGNPGDTPTETSVDYEHQHGHEIPSHRPRDFAHAAEVIEGLLQSAATPQGDSRLAQEQLADVIRWLPELAAQTDLSESEWTEVNDRSKQLTETFPSPGSLSTSNSLSEQTCDSLRQLAARIREMTRDGRWQSFGVSRAADSEDDELMDTSEEDTDRSGVRPNL